MVSKGWREDFFNNVGNFLVGVEFEVDVPKFSIIYTALTKTGEEIYSLIQDKEDSFDSLVDFMGFLEVPYKHKKLIGEYIDKNAEPPKANLRCIDSW